MVTFLKGFDSKLCKITFDSRHVPFTFLMSSLLVYEVFVDNTAEVITLKPVIEKIVKRFPIRRVIALADRGGLSTDNLADLQAIVLPGSETLEFILAVPGRRYGYFVELLAPFHAAQLTGKLNA